MIKPFISILLIISLAVSLNAENNNSTKIKPENNASKKVKRAEKQLQEQMKREEKYAKEQTFQHGKNYDLSDLEVDPKSLDAIPEIEPDYEFNMDDVYD